MTGVTVAYISCMGRVPTRRPARSLERLGFLREGLLRERWIVEGEVSDSEIYGLLRRDWEMARR